MALPRRFRARPVPRLEILEDRTLLSTSLPLDPVRWAELGPRPLLEGLPNAGRVEDVAAHPTDPNTLYVATTEGGVWKTTDGGGHWAPLTDNQPAGQTKAVAVAPSDPNVVYASIGGESGAIGGLSAAGILRSADGGQSWAYLGNSTFAFRTLWRIRVDPGNANVVYTVDRDGVWKSADGGTTWANTTAGLVPAAGTRFAFTDLAMDPGDPQTLYAASGTNGVYKTTNGGGSWAPAGNFPTGISDGFTRLAVTPANRQVVYAAISEASANGYRILRTTDGGATWAQTGTRPDALSLAVDPSDAGVLYAGARFGNIYVSGDGGATWDDLTRNLASGSGPHVDHHGVAFDLSGRLLDGDDGGLWRLDDWHPGSRHWTDLTGNLGDARVTDVSLYPSDPNHAIATVQDQNPGRFSDSLVWSAYYPPTPGGAAEAGNRLDPTNPQILYAVALGASTRNGVQRSVDGGRTWADAGITPADPNNPDPAYGYTPFVLDAARPTRLLLGTDRVYETTNRGDTWTPISTPKTNGWNDTSVVVSLAAAPTDVATVYAATDGGHLFVTTNDGTTWTLRDPMPGAGLFYSSILVDPRDSRTAYVTALNYGAGRLWRTTDGGATWKEISGNLPSLQAYAVVLDTRFPTDVLYAGLEDGVYVSTNLGVSWARAGQGLPHVRAQGLTLDADDGILAVATWGRGVWELAVPPPSVSFTAAAAGSEATTPVNLAVTLSRPASGPITVNYAATGGTATGGGVDYNLAAGTLTFNPGETTKTIPVTVVDDAIHEPDETIQVSLSAPTHAVLGGLAATTYTILDNDPVPTVQLGAAALAVPESAGTVALTVLLSNPTAWDVTVPFIVTGTATGGVDYTIDNSPLTIPAGAVAGTVHLNVLDDALNETDETVTVTLGTPTNATAGAPSAETVTIQDNDPLPQVTFSAPASQGPETTPAASLEVDLLAASGRPVTVDYAVTGGTAVAGVDYTLAAGTLTFAPGQTVAVIPFTVLDDQQDEPDETIVVSLSNPGNATPGPYASTTFTIVEDALQVSFAQAAGRGAESVAAPELDVTLSFPAGRTVTVHYAVTGGSATRALDYTLADGTLTFDPGEITRAVPLAVLDDNVHEPDETVQVSLSSPVNALLGVNPATTYTILDDDPVPTVQLGAAAQAVSESAGTVSLAVLLSNPTAWDVTVPFTVTGTATGGGVDYTIGGSPLTIPAGSTTATIPLTILNDALNEADETVIVTLGKPTNATAGATAAETVTIQDDDPLPQVAFATAAAHGPEDLTAVSLAVTLSAPSGRRVTVDYAVTGGTATDGVDYTLAPGTLTFAPGQTSAMIPLAVIEDLLHELDETVVVSLSNPGNATLGANAGTTYTILDNDPVVGFAHAGSQGAESVAAPRLTVALSSASNRTISVQYAVTGGTATRGDDYTLPDGTLTFSPGETSKDLPLAVLDDDVHEPNETIQVTLSSSVNAALGANTVTTYTIFDDDPVPAVALATAGQAVPESAGVVSVQVRLSNPSAWDVTVPYTVSGTAAAGVDYTVDAGPLVIPAGATMAAIPLTVLNDVRNEPDETVVLTLGTPTNAVPGATAAETVTIRDDDPPPQVAFAAAAAAGPESATAVALPVTLSVASGFPVMVDYAVTGGTATGGMDYTLAAGTLTLEPGQTSAAIPLAVVNDAVHEPDETVVVTLSNPAHATLGATRATTYTIQDDDPVPTVQFAVAAQGVAEGAGVLSLVVQLSNPSSADVAVPFTAGGTATAGADYTLAAGPLLIPAGATTATIPLTLVNDALNEPDETVVVTLGTPTNATPEAITAETVTIQDDDPAPSVSFVTAAAGGPGSAPGQLLVGLSAPSGQVVTVHYAVTGGTAVPDLDFRLPAGTLTFAPGQTVRAIPLGVVNAPGPDRTLALALSAPDHARLGDVSAAVYTIRADEPAGRLSGDVTARVSVRVVNARRKGPGGRVRQQVTVQNVGGQALAGPVLLVLGGLPRGVKLVGAAGVTLGSPYVILTRAGLAPGQSAGVMLQFRGTGRRPRYTPRVLAGAVAG